VSDFSTAFAELVDACQPDSDPVLTKGDGVTADVTKELDRILERNKTGTWAVGATVVYGQKVLPTSSNGHVYQAKQAGTTGSAEPSWGTADYSRVGDGTVVWEESGSHSGSPYNMRAAIHGAFALKLAKADEYTGTDEARIREHLEKQLRRYAPVGIA
jgi:hypothetical protein